MLGGAHNETLHFLSGFGATAGLVTGGFGVVLVGFVVAVAALLVWIELTLTFQ